MRLLGAMIAWSVFAVGGVYAWAGVPLMVAAAAIVAFGHLRPGTSRELRMLDVLLAATAVAAAIQLVPLPPFARAIVSSHADEVRRSLYLMPASAASWQPLTLAPTSTAYALGLLVTGLVVFWAARDACTRGLSLPIVRQVAFVGLAAAAVAIAFEARSDRRLVYGILRTIDAGPRTFGPFVNRNHFATWVLMACPLAAGYVVATMPERGSRRGASARLAAFLEWLGTSGAWVAAAAVVMIVGLLVSTSRSGLVAFAVSLVAGAWLARGRINRAAARVGIIAAVSVVAIVAAYVRVEPVILRVRETIAEGSGPRARIWSETIRVIRDFPITGTGLGSYQPAMLVYQQSDRTLFINQAHNQYLHFIAEGGLLLAIPALLAVAAFVRLVAVRLHADRSSSAWLRIGGAVAVLAVSVQGIWETGLRIPANGLLFAIAAAVAVHRPEDTW